VTDNRAELTTAASQLDEVIQLSNRLAALMSEETALLREMRVSEIALLQDQKSALANAYASAIGAVKRAPGALSEAPVDLKSALREATRRLQESLDANMRAVIAAKTVNERLIRVVSDAIAEMRSPAGAYTASGVVPSSADAAEPVSLAVDHRI